MIPLRIELVFCSEYLGFRHSCKTVCLLYADRFFVHLRRRLTTMMFHMVSSIVIKMSLIALEQHMVIKHKYNRNNLFNFRTQHCAPIKSN